MKQSKFKKFSDKKQWQWIIQNKELILEIELDNDVTFINLKSGETLKTDSYVDGPGSEFLFEAIGIKAGGV